MPTISAEAGIPTLVEEIVLDGRFLLCRSTGHYCALPLHHVVETMRAQRVAVLEGQPDYLLGVATIRGEATPVVELSRLFDLAERGAPARFVTLNLGDHRIAVGVDRVLGLYQLPEDAVDELPPLLRDLGNGALTSISTLDDSLLLVLQTSRLVPESIWSQLAGAAQ